LKTDQKVFRFFFFIFIIAAFLDDLLKSQDVTAALHVLLLDILPAPTNLLEQPHWQFILLAYFKFFLGPKHSLFSYEGCRTKLWALGFKEICLWL